MQTVFQLPTRIVFGVGSIESLGQECASLGKSALIVTGAHSARATGLLARVETQLAEKGIKSAAFERIRPNPGYATIDEAAKLVRDEGIDLIVGLGGGSAMDAAKAIRMVASSGKPVWQHFTEGSDAGCDGPLAGLVLVPTMAGTGSEASIVSVLMSPETHEKRAMRTPIFYPSVSIVDPELTVSLSAWRTAEGAIDMFCHVFEPYVTADTAFEISDGFMETVMRAAVNALPRALADPNDLEARETLSWVSTLALSGVMRLGGGGGVFSCHGFAQALNGHYRDLGHGGTLAYIMPAWLESIAVQRPE